MPSFKRNKSNGSQIYMRNKKTTSPALHVFLTPCSSSLTWANSQRPLSITLAWPWMRHCPPTQQCAHCQLQGQDRVRTLPVHHHPLQLRYPGKGMVCRRLIYCYFLKKWFKFLNSTTPPRFSTHEWRLPGGTTIIAARLTEPKTRLDAPRTPKVGALTHSDALHVLYFEARLNKIQISSHTRAAFGRKLLVPDRTQMAFPGGSVVKNLPANAGDSGLIPGQGHD